MPQRRVCFHQHCHAVIHNYWPYIASCSARCFHPCIYRGFVCCARRDFVAKPGKPAGRVSASSYVFLLYLPYAPFCLSSDSDTRVADSHRLSPMFRLNAILCRDASAGCISAPCPALQYHLRRGEVVHRSCWLRMQGAKES